MVIFYQKTPNKAGIAKIGKVYSCVEIGRIGGNWLYTLVMSPIKTAGDGVKKNIPLNYHGMFYITGGARNLLPLAYEKPAPKTQTKRAKTGKNREFLQKTVLLAIFYTT